MKTDKKNWFARHKVLTVILALVVVIAIGSAASGGGKSDKTANSSGSNQSSGGQKQEASTAKIGQAARDGKFEFVVKSIECGKASVGENQYLTKTAQGQYCLLNVSVKNIGNEKQSLFSANQKLLDAANKEYSADDTATLYAAPQGSSWYSDINPGNSVEGSIVFDVPKDVTPAVAQLHDSSLSGGVKVTLQ
jgi:Domain of unknown function (DUF4352)